MRFGTLDRRLRVVVVAAGLVCAMPGSAGAQNVETRPWSEILTVVGHDVALSLPGAYIAGKAVAVTPDALEVDVRETSNADVYAKGRVAIRRSLVSVIRLRKSDGRAPRVATQTIGSAAMLGGLYGLGARTGIRGTLRNAGVQIGAATLGAAIGRRFDDRKEEILIRIAPEPDTAAGRITP